MDARRRDEGGLPPAPGEQRVRLLDVGIDPLTLPALLTSLLQAIRRGPRVTVLYANVHCLNTAARDPEYRRILERADIVYCDGTGVRLGAWFTGQHLPERMTGADWIHDLCRLAVREHLSLFLLGSAEGSARDAARLLTIRYPGLHIAGTLPGYGAGRPAIDAINASGADIVLVGMGTPTQERWINEHRAELQAPVVWAVGALFDFVSGRIPRGPRWMTDHGLEWLCRLVAEPRKLWRRYLLGNPAFAARLLQQRRAQQRKDALRPGGRRRAG